MQTRPKIGVFDSGIGGFSVLKACLRRMPATYYYYGDNLRAPYGSRPPEEIAAFTEEALRVFEKIGTDAAVLACNTATAVCIDRMREKFSFPVVGVEPAVAPAAREGRRVLVLATPRTAQSARLQRLLARFPQTEFQVFAPERLAAAVEDLFLRGVPLDYGEHLPEGHGCDCAVLGCTHYALVKEQIAHFLGMKVFDGAEGTARRVVEVIKAGTTDHLQPRVDFAENSLHIPSNFSNFEVHFLGSGHHVNEYLFETNIRFDIL